MENTKDIVYSVQYLSRVGEGRRIRRKNKSSIIIEKIKDNKAAIIIISTMTSLMAIDFILINKFMNLLTQWVSL